MQLSPSEHSRKHLPPQPRRPKHRGKGVSRIIRASVLRRVDGRLQKDAAYYRPGLDELWDTFGADRLIYGSNWPVSDNVGPYDIVFEVVHGYFATKGMDASQKFFSKNSKIAYRWTGRSG